MPEETPADEQTPKRMTTAEAARTAQDAMALAAAVDERMDEVNVKLTDIEQRLQDGGGSASPDDDRLPWVVAQVSEMLPAAAQQAQQLAEIRAQLKAGSGSPGADEVRQLIDGRLVEALQPIEKTIVGLARRTQNAEGEVQALAASRPGGVPAVKLRGAQHKVLQLMRLVANIGKEKEAVLGDRGGRFMYRGIDDAMDAVGHAMREVGLIYSPEILDKQITQNTGRSESTYNGKTTIRDTIYTTVIITARYTFIDPDDGSTHPVEMVGEGRDGGDKATSKAAAMAMKYALLHGLMIPVEGMPDSDAENPQLTSERVEDRTPTRASREAYEAAPDNLPHPPPPSDPVGDNAKRSRHERAVNALTALRSLDRVPAEERAGRLGAIRNQIEQEGLGPYEIEGSTLRAWGVAVGRTLGGGDQ